MQRIMGPAFAAALLFGASVALAAEASGTIEAIDPAAGTLVLSDGAVYKAGENVDLSALQPGTAVILTYDEVNGEKVISGYSM
jgi:hypothetical protein